MRTFGLAVALCCACAVAVPTFAPTPVLAQSDAAASNGESATPDLAALMKNVSAVAERLQNNVGNLEDRIQDSQKSAEVGEKLLTEMLESARALQESLGRDSDIWADLNRLMDDWGAKRDAALKASETKPQFAEIAELWQEKLDEALKLRESILSQAAESAALVDAIESQREIVLAYYEVQAADKVLETMRAMSDDLTVMNESMKGIVAQTGIVVGPEVGQE